MCRLQFLTPCKGEKKKKKSWWREQVRNPLPFGSWWDIFTLPSIYKAGKSVPPGWHKQKCLCDEPEKTSSIRLYIFISQLFTQTLSGVKTGPQPADHHTPMETHNSHSLRNNWLENSVWCVFVFVCISAVYAWCQRSSCRFFLLSFNLTSLVVVHTCLCLTWMSFTVFPFHSSQLTNEIPE